MHSITGLWKGTNEQKADAIRDRLLDIAESLAAAHRLREDESVARALRSVEGERLVARFLALGGHPDEVGSERLIRLLRQRRVHDRQHKSFEAPAPVAPAVTAGEAISLSVAAKRVKDQDLLAAALRRELALAKIYADEGVRRQGWPPAAARDGAA